MSQPLRIGFLLNPIAGLGGQVALRGSDGVARQAEARARGGEPRAYERARAFLDLLVQHELRDALSWFSWQGMGAEALGELDIPHECLGSVIGEPDATDTARCVRAMCDRQVDLLIFTGGDGTAVDVMTALDGEDQLCLGIPAGVKMHSGVFAVAPAAAAAIVQSLLCGDLVSSLEGEVVDFDDTEQANDSIKVVRYGQLRVPAAGGWMQHTKEGGRESEPLVVAEICADVVERWQDECPMILGPGSTLQAVKSALGATDPTLRGFDIYVEHGEWLWDVTATQLESYADKARLLLSFTRNQGFLVGRGNLELSQTFLQRLDPELLEIVGTRSKLLSLEGRPLLIDCGDAGLDARFAGLVEVIAGYEDRLLYRLQAASMIEAG